jgi:hypothetical protein
MIEALAFTLVVVAARAYHRTFSVVRTGNEWNRDTPAVHLTGRSARLLSARHRRPHATALYPQVLSPTARRRGCPREAGLSMVIWVIDGDD